MTGRAGTEGVEGAAQADFLRLLSYVVETMPFPYSELRQPGKKIIDADASSIGGWHSDREVKANHDRSFATCRAQALQQRG